MTTKEDNRKLNKKIIPSIVLYILAVITLAYAIWAFIFYSDMVSQAVADGYLVIEGSEFDIVNLFMGYCFEYLIYAALLAAAGLLLQRACTVTAETAANELSDDEEPAYEAGIEDDDADDSDEEE